MRARLSPTLYRRLQEFVHDYDRTVASLVELMAARPGETLVEVGCGTGALAPAVLRAGFAYVGIEIDQSRVELARRTVPGARFLVGDARDVARLELPETPRVFIHGMLHHVDDDQCREILAQALSLRSDVVLAVVEPFRPPSFPRAPFGTLLAWLDEGRHVRSLERWRELFGANLDALRTVDLKPRWPVPLLHARLLPRTP